MPAVCLLVDHVPIAVISGEKWSEVYEDAYRTFMNPEFLNRLRRYRYRGKPMWDGASFIKLDRATEEQERAIGVKAGWFLFMWLHIPDADSVIERKQGQLPDDGPGNIRPLNIIPCDVVLDVSWRSRKARRLN